MARGPQPINLATVRFDWTRTYVMGVLNVTPDSFSDGGAFLAPGAAIAAGVALREHGADLVDVGGESTRPSGARPVDAAEELERVVPVIRGLVARGVPVSIDTTKAAVAAGALAAGAEVVNDISGGLFDPVLLQVTADAGAAYVCGHVRGRDLAAVHAAEQAPPTFDEVAAELAARLDALPAGLRERTLVDPGLGFGKGVAENLELSRRAGELRARLGCAVMLGPSRKRYLGELTGAPVGERDAATVGAALAGVAGGADFVRVHAVHLLAPALVVYEASGGRVR
jgi:dihydropteroate synthase